VRRSQRRRDRAESVARFTIEPAVPDATEEIAWRDRVLQALLNGRRRLRRGLALRGLAGVAVIGLVGGPVSGPVPSGPAETSYFTPAEFKADLARPGWKITGYQTIDGHSAVEISFAEDGLTSDIWADARTYEVVRTLRKLPRLGTITQNYYWVPRTTAMTTLINHPRIPAGYRRVPAD
jgi:hypothetical protein